MIESNLNDLRFEFNKWFWMVWGDQCKLILIECGFELDHIQIKEFDQMDQIKCYD